MIAMYTVNILRNK